MMNRRLNLAICLALAVATLVALLPVLRADFMPMDDDQYVTRNPGIQSGLTREAVAWAFMAVRACTWQPMVWLSYALDYSLWELNPFGYHLTNLLLHIANVVLLFLVLSRMTGCVWRSAFVAAMFAVHPLRVESVAWVAERKDVLSALFWMLTMWAYARYVEEFKVQGSRFKVGAYMLVVVFFALGLMAKPMLVTLPFVLLLLDYWPLGRVGAGIPPPSGLTHLESRIGDGASTSTSKSGDGASTSKSTSKSRSRSKIRGLVMEKLPLLPLVAASTVITYIAQQQGGAITSFDRLPLGLRIPNAIVSSITYIRMMLWPTKLGVLYPHPRATLPVWLVVLSALLVVLLTWAALRAARRRPWAAVGWAWYLLTLLPVIGIIQIGPHALADRFTYIPQIGLYIILAWGIPELFSCGQPESEAQGPRPARLSVLPLLAGIVLTALAATTLIQTGYWRNSVRILKHTLGITSHNWLVYNRLGSVLVERGRPGEGKLYLLHARDIAPNAEVENNLGVVAEKLGRVAEAEPYYRRAVQLDPTYKTAHYNLGNALFRSGRFAEAAREYSLALKRDPEMADAAFKVGLSLAGLGRADEATAYYRRALRIDPRHVYAHRELAGILAARGKSDEAIEHYRRALEVEPDDALMRFNLGSLLGAAGRIDDEIEQYREALRINPKLAEAHGNLAIALYYKGRYREAWDEVELCRKYGADPSPDFIRALSNRMPQPL